MSEIKLEYKSKLTYYLLDFESKYEAYLTFLNIHCILEKIDLTNMDKELFVLYWMYGVNRDAEKVFLEKRNQKTKMFMLRNCKTALHKSNMIVKVGKSKYQVKEEFSKIDVFDIECRIHYNNSNIDGKISTSN